MKADPTLIQLLMIGTLAVLLVVPVTEARAAESGTSFAAGFDYSTGNYGAASSTSILSIPVVGSYSSDLWNFKLTVPYVWISGLGGVTANGIRTRVATRNKVTTESGLGDVVAAASYNVYPGSEQGSRVDLTGKIKFATASTALGTGRNDYAAQVDVYQGYGSLTATGTLGYAHLGSPSGLSMNNVAYGTVGGYDQFTEQTVGGVELSLSQKPSSLGVEQREMSIYAYHSLNGNTKIRGYVLKGFADGSPDSGFGLQLIKDL